MVRLYKEPVKIDDPCTAVDIVPTLLNLFGFDYDSRLLSGRDVLAPDADPGNVSTDMHVAIFADYGGGYSWITRAAPTRHPWAPLPRPRA